MVENNGMENIFKKIGSKRFVRFNGGSGQKKKTIGSNNLENDGRNDQILSTNNSKQNWIFHPHRSSQDGSGTDQVPAVATIHGLREYRRPCLAVEANDGIFRTHMRKEKQRTQVSIEWKGKECIWRDDELNINNTLKTKPKARARNQN